MGGGLEKTSAEEKDGWIGSVVWCGVLGKIREVVDTPYMCASGVLVLVSDKTWCRPWVVPSAAKKVPLRLACTDWAL